MNMFLVAGSILNGNNEEQPASDQDYSYGGKLSQSPISKLTVKMENYRL